MRPRRSRPPGPRQRRAPVGVVGGGIIGSWTALHLAELGADTTLFEQFPLPHTRGSSHGASRAFRWLGDEDLERLDYSLDRWLALEKATGETLFVKTGLLNFGPPGDPFLDRHLAILRRAGRRCEWLGSADVAARFPMLRYPDEWGAAWDPDAGVLFAHRCLSAVQTHFEDLGGRIVTARVESVAPGTEAGARLSLRSDTTRAIQNLDFDRVVVCAGPWTAKLLPRLAGTLRSLAIPVTYWRDPSASCDVANGFPILFNARLTGIYALPSCEYPGLVKVLFHGGPEADPDTRDRETLAPYIDKVSHYVRDHLPHLDHRRPAITEPCMYTMTPDGDPILDRLAAHLVVGCGFSGSGFKHSPATGRMLAALALDRVEELPDGFRIGRFGRDRFHQRDSGCIPSC